MKTKGCYCGGTMYSTDVRIQLDDRITQLIPKFKSGIGGYRCEMCGHKLKVYPKPNSKA